MKRAIQVSLMVFAIASMSFSAHAGPISKEGPSISDAISQGYQFTTGTGLGITKEVRVAINSSRPYAYGNVQFQDGYLYLMKGKVLLICSYTIVLSNPSEEQDVFPPSSRCFEVK